MSDPSAFEEAAIGILAAVMLADGVVAADELAWWARLRQRHPSFTGMDAPGFDRLTGKARETLAAKPWAEAIDDWAAHIPPAHAETLYALAVELQLVDGQSTRSESRVTAHLARALGLSPARAMQIFELEVHRRLGDH